LAVIATIAAADPAKAEDVDRPTVWIELGGQLSRLQDGQEAYQPPFLALTPSIFPAPYKNERPPLYDFDGSAGLKLQPNGSDWSFSASIRFGRVSTDKHVHHQTYPESQFQKPDGSYYPFYPLGARFTDVKSKQIETNAVVDFQAGKDVGLGLFGHNATSTLNFGVRIAQFTSKSRTALAEDPDWHTSIYVRHYGPNNAKYRTFAFQNYHSYKGAFTANRSFNGVGPSLSWNSSVPVAGNSQGSELTVDWGVNGAVLFGRQKTRTQHQTSAWYHSEKTHKPASRIPKVRHLVYQTTPSAQNRSHSVTVPNL
jgi:hypothetical protein